MLLAEASSSPSSDRTRPWTCPVVRSDCRARSGGEQETASRIGETERKSDNARERECVCVPPCACGCVCMCVCECVSVCEGERESEMRQRKEEREIGKERGPVTRRGSSSLL